MQSAAATGAALADSAVNHTRAAGSRVASRRANVAASSLASRVPINFGSASQGVFCDRFGTKFPA